MEKTLLPTIPLRGHLEGNGFYSLNACSLNVPNHFAVLAAGPDYNPRKNRQRTIYRGPPSLLGLLLYSSWACDSQRSNTNMWTRLTASSAPLRTQGQRPEDWISLLPLEEKRVCPCNCTKTQQGWTRVSSRNYPPHRMRTW